jgi:hypothetical protein
LSKHIEILKQLNMQWDEPRYSRIKGLKKFVISHPLELSLAWSASQGDVELTSEGDELLTRTLNELIQVFKVPESAGFESLNDLWDKGSFDAE